MSILHPRTFLLLACACLLHAAQAAESPVAIPTGVVTHADGRAPIEALYRAALGLVEKGWRAEVITQSAPAGTTAPLPIIALRSPKTGPAVWILAGIHGEEPAGPNAIAAEIEDIAALGASRPVVLMPLLNPQGYARNWRYLNVPVYSETIDGQSVGDSSHLLPSDKDPSQPRAPAASSPEAAAITAFVLRQQADYPVAVSIDLHEDNLINEGYVYSQGVEGGKDPLAAAAVERAEGERRAAQDGRHDALRRADRAGHRRPGDGQLHRRAPERTASRRRGCVAPGPAAHTVLVFETPAAALSLERRVAAHAALIRRLAARLGSPPGGT